MKLLDMETTFKYQDKIITTPNLEKKLKRMKLTLEDIEIIPTQIKEKPKSEGWEFEGIKEWRYFKQPDGIIQCWLQNIGEDITDKYPELKMLNEVLC